MNVMIKNICTWIFKTVIYYLSHSVVSLLQTYAMSTRNCKLYLSEVNTMHSVPGFILWCSHKKGMKDNLHHFSSFPSLQFFCALSSSSLILPRSCFLPYLHHTAARGSFTTWVVSPYYTKYVLWHGFLWAPTVTRVFTPATHFFSFFCCQCHSYRRDSWWGTINSALFSKTHWQGCSTKCQYLSWKLTGIFHVFANRCLPEVGSVDLIWVF